LARGPEGEVIACAARDVVFRVRVIQLLVPAIHGRLLRDFGYQATSPGAGESAELDGSCRTSPTPPPFGSRSETMRADTSAQSTLRVAIIAIASTPNTSTEPMRSAWSSLFRITKSAP